MLLFTPLCYLLRLLQVDRLALWNDTLPPRVVALPHILPVQVGCVVGFVVVCFVVSCVDGVGVW